MPSTRDQRPYNVSYYRRNRQQEIDRVMTRQHATLEFLRDLRRVPCKDCGRRFQPHQMDFDHRDPKQKSFNVTTSRAMLMRRERLMLEVAKCDIVCANCHSVRTYALQAERSARRRAEGSVFRTPRSISMHRRALPKRDFLLELRDKPCLDCGGRFPPFAMQFDHRDPGSKQFNVASSWCRSRASVLKEAAKCDIVCHNCHRDRTFQRRQRAGVAQLVRAAAFQAAGRGFETRLPLSYDEHDEEQRRLLESMGGYAA